MINRLTSESISSCKIASVSNELLIRFMRTRKGTSCNGGSAWPAVSESSPGSSCDSRCTGNGSSWISVRTSAASETPVAGAACSSETSATSP
ncbi:MAG TPA: hypothetical protein EYN03_01055 [Planctomycetes bacterium]|nr:hypothetical protein [Planctomycetaceae bacterium]HIN94207.1 hypothetical protein [Planctomycetota bacterium]